MPGEWLVLAGVVLAAYPTADWLLTSRYQKRNRLLTVLLSVAISPGCITLIMMWESFAGIKYDFISVTAVYLALMTGGGVMWWRSRLDRTGSEANRLSRSEWFMAGVMVCVSGAILFNAAYWPFYEADAVGIYNNFGHYMYIERSFISLHIPDYSNYQAYPMMIPLTYTYSYLAAGWENAYLAKTVSAVLSLGCVGTAGILGGQLYGRRAGWMAAILLVLTPAVVRWASSGYTDLPMAFYYTMAAIFGWRTRETGQTKDAALAGIMLGLAAWTKNAALTGVALYGGWLVVMVMLRTIKLRQALVVMAACALMGAPWYVRNLLELGLLVPATAWTEQAERTFSSLLVFITKPENFALTGWAVMIGGGYWIIRMIWQRERWQETLLVCCLTLPFFGVWWLLVSYDPRFLLLFLPILAAMAGGWLARMWDRLQPAYQEQMRLPLMLGAVVMGVYMAWIAVSFKQDILRNPLMGESEKLAIVSESQGE